MKINLYLSKNYSSFTSVFNKGKEDEKEIQLTLEEFLLLTKAVEEAIVQVQVEKNNNLKEINIDFNEKTKEEIYSNIELNKELKEIYNLNILNTNIDCIIDSQTKNLFNKFIDSIEDLKKYLNKIYN